MFLLLFVFGLFVGSFLGVLVDRLPRGESFARGRSYCENCKHALGILDLIPVVSFFALRGRCRYCKGPLSLFYPAIELSTGVSYAAAVYLMTFTSSAHLALFLAIISSFIVVFFTDIKYGIIPDKIIFPAGFVYLVWLLIVQPSLLANHLTSAIGAFAFFFLIFLISRGRGMGFGDVKLVLLMGLILGFPSTLFAIYLAFLTGALVSIILILRGRKRLKGSTIPFGPFLVASTFLTVYFGKEIQSVFAKLFGISS